MSFSLSVSGHHGDADHHAVENTVRRHARAIRDELDALGVIVAPSFSGTTGSGIDEDTEPVPVDDPGSDDAPATQ